MGALGCCLTCLKARPTLSHIGVWGGGLLECKPLLVKWSMVCLDKRSGGLGVKNLSSLNKALLSKWS